MQMQTYRIASRLQASAARFVNTRCMSTTNIAGGSMGRTWADKERAEEKVYFSKQDAENLSKLAAKLKQTTAPTDQMVVQEKEAIAEILTHHGISSPPDALVDDIIKFKFNHH